MMLMVAVVVAMVAMMMMMMSKGGKAVKQVDRKADREGGGELHQFPSSPKSIGPEELLGQSGRMLGSYLKLPSISSRERSHTH